MWILSVSGSNGIFHWIFHGIALGITLWLFSIAMENGPFIDGLPINNGDFPWLC
jgi:hypothetical protein